MILAIFIFTFLWACVATLMVIRNPFPFPDRGHRCYSVRDEKARHTVVKAIETVTSMRARFTFDFGPTHQTVFWDGATTIVHLEPKSDAFGAHPCNGISLTVPQPIIAAERAAEILRDAGFTARINTTLNDGLPPDHFALLFSDAFDGWALAFRKTMLKMPRPQIRKRIRY